MSLSIGHWIPAYNEAINVNIVAQALMDNVACGRAGHAYRFWANHTCDLPALRNQAMQKALDLGIDFLFMQDADVYVDCGGSPLMRLLSTALETEATITGALVTMRSAGARANVWPVKRNEVYEAEKIGTGMILVNLGKVRDWYDEYEGPCFARAYATNKQVKPIIGSDIFFSKVVRGHGQKIVCDARIPTVHINACERLRYDPAFTGADGTGTPPGETK